MSLDVAIIGGGHNGLVAAFYLARAGLRVEVFERRSFAGGAAMTEELWPGFRFSTCAHMVHSLHPKILRDLTLVERGLAFCRRKAGIAFRADGTYFGPSDLNVPGNLAFAGRLTPEERQGLESYEAFKQHLRRLFAPYRLGPPPSFEDLRRRAAGTPEGTALERAAATRLWGLHDAFLPTALLRDRYATEGAAIGRNPLGLCLAYSSGSEPEEETGQSPPYGFVRGGLGALSRVLAEAAEEAGAKIHLNRGVRGVRVENGHAIGLRLEEGIDVRCRVVVSNLDPKRTFLRMVDAPHLVPEFRQRVEALVTNVSCYKLLAVISELPKWRGWEGDPQRPHEGAVVIGGSIRADVAAAHDDCAAGRPPRAPVISLSVPSVPDPSVTRTGYHTASAWILPAPARLEGTDWEQERGRVTDALIEQITSYAPNFRDTIRHCKLRTPLDLERENGLTDGCIWHVQHSGEQLFWNRPLPELAAYRAPLTGLYLCGAGQHPGGEVTGMPGHNAAQEILKDVGAEVGG